MGGSWAFLGWSRPLFGPSWCPLGSLLERREALDTPPRAFLVRERLREEAVIEMIKRTLRYSGCLQRVRRSRAASTIRRTPFGGASRANEQKIRWGGLQGEVYLPLPPPGLPAQTAIGVAPLCFLIQKAVAQHFTVMRSGGEGNSVNPRIKPANCRHISSRTACIQKSC